MSRALRSVLVSMQNSDGSSPSNDTAVGWQIPMVIVSAGWAFGACMGSFSADSWERLLSIPYVAMKLPLLIFTTSLVCLPGFIVLNTVLGLQADFAVALRAIAVAQAALALVLASLGPLTCMFYLSGISHDGALQLNAFFFLVATLAGQLVMRRGYGRLTRHPERGARHRVMLWAWTVLYAFVGMQMGWMLRPFVGDPALPVRFLRAAPFTNAYVAVLQLFL
jgi:hypothetical protein